MLCAKLNPSFLRIDYDSATFPKSCDKSATEVRVHTEYAALMWSFTREICRTSDAARQLPTSNMSNIGAEFSSAETGTKRS